MEACAIAKCNTAKAVPLRLVLPVPTLGNGLHGESFHGRQRGGHFERHTRYSRAKPCVTSSKHGNFVRDATICFCRRLTNRGNTYRSGYAPHSCSVSFFRNTSYFGDRTLTSQPLTPWKSTRRLVRSVMNRISSPRVWT